MQARGIVVERIAIAERQGAVDREGSLARLLDAGIGVEIDSVGRVADQTDERLELRDRHQHTGRLDRHIRQLGGSVAPDAVADQKVGLEVEKFWDDGKETAHAAAAEDHVVREVGAAAKRAAKAVSLK